jgi:hypothetical protein
MMFVCAHIMSSNLFCDDVEDPSRVSNAECDEMKLLEINHAPFAPETQNASSQPVPRNNNKDPPPTLDKVMTPI